MSFKIKNRSEARRAPKPLARALPPQPTPQTRLLAPLAMPETPMDVSWSSEPRFGRSPRGWYRTGLYA